MPLQAFNNIPVPVLLAQQIPSLLCTEISLHYLFRVIKYFKGPLLHGHEQALYFIFVYSI